MSWKATVLKGAAVVWAIVLIAAFVLFAGVTFLIPSTKSGRIHVKPEESVVAPAPPTAEAASTQPAEGA